MLFLSVVFPRNAMKIRLK